MQNAFKSNEWRWIWIYKTFKIQKENRRPNNSDFLQNWFPPEITSPLLYLWTFQYSEKSTPESCRMNWNLMNDEEWVRKTFKIEIQKGRQNNSDFLQNWFPPEIMSPLFYLSKFQDSEKSTPESCAMHSNLVNDNKFGSTKLLKFKYRRGDQIIQTFCKIGSP